MGYRCGICNAPVKGGQPMLKHIEHKADGNIRREVPVCYLCRKALDAGHTVQSLERAANAAQGKKKGVTVVEVPAALILTPKIGRIV